VGVVDLGAAAERLAVGDLRRANFHRYREFVPDTGDDARQVPLTLALDDSLSRLAVARHYEDSDHVDEAKPYIIMN